MSATPAPALARASWRTVGYAWALVAYAIVNFMFLSLIPVSVQAGLPARTSPLLVPVLALLIAGGPWLLAAVHLGAAATLFRLGPWLAPLVAFSAFFWIDMLAGSFFTLVAVAAAFAIAGSRIGAIAFLALCLLMPSPVVIPLAAWLLWRQPEVRAPFAALLAINVIGVALSGRSLEWLNAVVQAASEGGGGFAIGQGLVVGPAWLLIGIPIAAVMVWRGSARVAALAGLVLAPFILPQYLLLAVVALAPSKAWERAILPHARAHPERAGSRVPRSRMSTRRIGSRTSSPVAGRA